MIKKNAIWARLGALWLCITFGILAQESPAISNMNTNTPLTKESQQVPETSTQKVSPEPTQPLIRSSKTEITHLEKPEVPQLEKLPDMPQETTKKHDDDITLTERELALTEKQLESEIELNFNNASLQNIVDQISQLFNLTFIPDNVVKTPDSTAKALSESKISFNTHRPLTKKKAWSLFTTFLELAGWALASTPDARIYRITAIDNANKSPLPTYINTTLDLLPKTNQRIRYVCFLENSTPALMQPLLEKLKSAKAQIDQFALLRAIIITDAAYNIYSLMQIVRELDKTSSSQTLSVINLREADASEVEALIKVLQDKKDDAQVPWLPKKESSVFYFSKDVSVIAAPRTNSLIIIGPKEGVKRIEQFILTHIDTRLTQRYDPVHVYNLNYAPAEQVATILNSVITFGKGAGGDQKTPTVGESGGVLGGLKYFGTVYIEPEKQNNRLIIRSSEEDFQHLKQIIEQLDQRQLQVAIEVMILEIDLDRKRQWGIQWNTKENRTINAQLSGFWGEVGPQTTSANGVPSKYSNSIISNLISLAKYPEAGSTILTLGKDSIYAIAGILESDGQTRVIANPFIVATNKYRASVAIAEERRAQMQTIQGTTTGTGEGSFNAKWEVSITPQINEAGIINLDIDVILEDFTTAVSGTSPSNANKTTRRVQTNTNVANKETIALGGLVKKKKTAGELRFPVLSRIPIIGNLFKNIEHENIESTLVILMHPTIIYPSDEIVGTYTKNKADELSIAVESATNRHERNPRDPLYHWFFKAADDTSEKDIRDFVYRKPQKDNQPAPLKPEIANTIIQSALKDKEENQ